MRRACCGCIEQNGSVLNRVGPDQLQRGQRAAEDTQPHYYTGADDVGDGRRWPHPGGPLPARGVCAIQSDLCHDAAKTPPNWRWNLLERATSMSRPRARTAATLAAAPVRRRIDGSAARYFPFAELWR